MNHHYPHATGVFFWGNTGTPPIFRAQTQTRSLSSNSSAVLCSIPISEWARGVSQRLLTQPSTCPCPSLWLIIMSFNYQWIGWREKPYFFPKKKQSIEIKIYDILRTMEVPQYWNQWMRGCQSSWRFAVYEEEGIHNGLPVKMGCDLHREDWVAIASWKEHL